MRHRQPAERTQGGPQRHVLVINQYALPRERAGGTRHIDLFGRLEGWQPLIVAAGRDHYSQETFRSDDERFRLVWVPPYRGNGVSRVLGWILYSVQTALIGLSRRRLDVVYASTPSLLAPVAGLLIARIRRVPLVVEVRDLWPETIVAAGALREGSALHRGLLALERWMIGSADSIVAVTPGWEDHFSALGIPSGKVSVIPNGADTADFDAARRGGVRDRHTVMEPLTAVFAGAHGEKDGLNHILDAAAELPEMKFLLVGAGPAKSRAVARAESEALTNVSFLSPVPKSELGDLLSRCDIGIHAVTPFPVFLKGMSPNKLFDYMAAGLPVVSNMEEGLSGVLRDGECGRLGGPTDLASCLREVGSVSGEQRQRWGERGRQIVRERFSRTAAAEALRTVLETVDGPPGKAVR
jgi:glycosyltransferase involved in cell wall biosynthesis